jgi:hypothetical protein
MGFECSCVKNKEAFEELDIGDPKIKELSK